VREGWTNVRMLPLLDTSVALLVEICGDKPLDLYGRDVNDYRDILSRLPKHRLLKPWRSSPKVRFAQPIIEEMPANNLSVIFSRVAPL
jgi:hypothetical protein